jgi:hypothetical protein
VVHSPARHIDTKGEVFLIAPKPARKTFSLQPLAPAMSPMHAPPVWIIEGGEGRASDG